MKRVTSDLREDESCINLYWCKRSSLSAKIHNLERDSAFNKKLVHLYLNICWKAFQASKAHGAVIWIDSVVAAEYLSPLQPLLQLPLPPVPPEARSAIWCRLICRVA